MNANELLNREELIEQASLDAMGLLDDFEASHFSKSFHAASATVQEEIRQLQAAVVVDSSMLSDELPAAGLRGRVLGAVMDALEDEATEFQPIATIGTRVRRSTVATPSDVNAHVMDSIQHERRAANYRAMSRTLVMWRAASVGLAAALLVSLVWVSMVAGEAVKLGQLAYSTETASQVSSTLGPSFQSFLNSGTKIRSLVPVNANLNVSATVLVDPKTGESVLVAFGLDLNQVYTVRMIDAQGQHDLGSVTGKAVQLSGALLRRTDGQLIQTCKLQLIDSDGQVVLETA